jgi:Carboxypeptidase regulatory-like domain/TonB-dependent Receptor Plug Domain
MESTTSIRARSFATTLFVASLLFPSAASSSATAVTIRGRVIEAVTGTPIAGALVSAGTARVRSGADGRFVLVVSEESDGAVDVLVSADGYLDHRSSIVPTLAGREGLEVALFRLGQFSETVEVRAETNRPEEPSFTQVEPDRVLDVAGGIDNVFRTLETLPGLSGSRTSEAVLSVRGGSPDENLTVMDGVEIHDPYRLFGLTSAFNPETIESFAFTAGGFSAKYGDGLSSLLVVQNRAVTRAPPSKAPHP